MRTPTLCGSPSIGRQKTTASRAEDRKAIMPVTQSLRLVQELGAAACCSSSNLASMLYALEDCSNNKSCCLDWLDRLLTMLHEQVGTESAAAARDRAAAGIDYTQTVALPPPTAHSRSCLAPRKSATLWPPSKNAYGICLCG